MTFISRGRLKIQILLDSWVNCAKTTDQMELVFIVLPFKRITVRQKGVRGLDPQNKGTSL